MLDRTLIGTPYKTVGAPLPAVVTVGPGTLILLGWVPAHGGTIGRAYSRRNLPANDNGNYLKNPNFSAKSYLQYLAALWCQVRCGMRRNLSD